MPTLYDPIQIGSIKAANRVVMAPLTRARSSRDGVPSEMMIEYYGLRADSGLIISEATGISRVGLGWAFAPGIWTDEQVEHWKPVVAKVHANGGKIINQLWHMGRATHSNVIGEQPVSASATAMPGPKVHTYAGKLDVEEARALSKAEIKSTVEDYRHAARNAIAAGFDGVQIHSANGYLLDQFLRSSSNLRTDEYGGSVENRIRFLSEVVAAVVAEVGPERTSVRFSPNGDAQGVIDNDPATLFAAAARMLQSHGVSMVELRENSPTGTFWGSTDQPKVHGAIRENFKGVLILNQDYSPEEAEAEVSSGEADAISFGRPYIANPDLVTKLKNKQPLRSSTNEVQWWYSQGREGYLDFPLGSD